MVTETLEQLRARLDQYGAKSEDVDFVVDIIRQIDANHWLLPLSLLAIAEAADRIETERAGMLALDAYKAYFEEAGLERGTE